MVSVVHGNHQTATMITSFRTSVAVFALINLHVGALDTFIAAVYEHAVILPNATGKPVSQENALLLMNKNIDILEKAIKQAAAQGAQIIVTPEDALYGWTFTREKIFPYLEDIPDPQVNWIPCQQPRRFGHTPVQTRLSCLAKNSSIYVLANIGDKKPCNSSDSKCPPDGYYQYNTNVVYDKEGKLVARYHKYHLYSEPQFDVPKKPELVTFNTTFGRFGIFTCFDILFHDPAITLVEDFQVDTILFPTAWMNVLPFLTAIEFHSAWAVGMRVNLLAADTHNVELKMTGSGIYAPHSPKEFYYNMASGTGSLVLAELDSHPRASPDYPPAVNWSVYARTIKPFPVQKSIFGGLVSQDRFNFTELFENEGNLTVCQEDLCCHLSYRMAGKEKDEVYVLGAFTGLHGRRQQEYWQVCTMMKCQTTDRTTCGKPVETALTRFDMFSLSGTFGTNYVFPEVLLTDIHLSPGKFEVLKDGRLVNKNGTSRPILTVSLFGRWYKKDRLSISGKINKTETPIPREDALLLMNKNMDVLENAVQLAAKQGAHIIVTPEDGIYGWDFTRETIYPYLEDIPDPKVNWIPCKDPQRFGYTPVQERLSCLAKNNSIYVVANIGDKKPCNISDLQCPPDGRYQYNTNVVFDSEGRLVARYHKYNLFAPEIQFDFPKDSELVTFDTPFGKFGIFTCFDIFSHDPAVMVVNTFQIDSVLFPSAWYNLLPLLSAAPFHSAWARTMRVNLLAANTHDTRMHMTGSGIYAPEAVKVYHYDMETDSGQLMLSELKSRPRSEPSYPATVDWRAYATGVKPFSSEQSHFPGMIYFDEFTFTELKKNAGNYSVCQKDLCCHLTYKMSEKRTDEVYVLGAFDGLHTVEGQYYLQICTLLKCQTTDLGTCGEPVGSAFTKFEEFSLSGTFGTNYVFPQIVLSGSQLTPERHYEVSRDGRLKNRSRTPLPVLVMALYGRVFEKDPPRLGQGPGKLQGAPSRAPFQD